MPQFPRRNTQPMRPDSYLRIARLLRGIADRIEAAADAADRHQIRVLSMMLGGLVKQARSWDARHRATQSGSLHVPPR